MDANAHPASLRGHHVLLAEDDLLIAADLQEALEEEGAVVLGPFGSVEAALRCAETAPRIDGGVLDIDLMGEAVFPVARALRERGVPFVFATGHVGPLRLPRGLQHVPCWAKPFPSRALASTLPSLMRGR
jgi:CheY-like chemotaxis protein